MSSITINSNVSALNTQRRLAHTTSRLRDSFSRLSSGLRINKASDDAAGLAIATELSVERQLYSQAVRNVNDGVSLLSIADGALNELSSITIRLTELAEQAANGALSLSQRTALDQEAQALRDEFFRISRTTEFNEVNLFDGNFEDLRLQVGSVRESGIVSNLGGAVGTGEFQTATAVGGTTGSSRGIATGDLNGDGYFDAVSANSDGSVDIFLGESGNTFSFTQNQSIHSSSSTSAELVDVNNDGTLDLVTGGVTSGNGTVAVSLGDGQGGFSATLEYTATTSAIRGVSVGDVDGDGAVDIVAGGTSGANGVTRVLLNNGDGTFRVADSYTGVAEGFNAVTLEDLDNDGDLDLLAGGFDSSLVGVLSVRLNDGSGTFGSAVSIATEPRTTYAITTGDFNGDGIFDIITGGYDGLDSFATIMIGDGSGTFSVSETLSLDGFAAYGVELVDLNGDQALDLVTTSNAGLNEVFLGDGAGSFTASFSIDNPGLSRGLAIVDINGDGVPDILNSGSNGGAATLTFNLAETVSGVSPLAEFSLTTLAGARQALPQFAKRLDTLAAQRGQIGAFESRLNTAVGVARVARENFSAAESQILDADIAVEAAGLVRNQILQQAGAAILSQANQTPALALTLLE